MKLRAALLFSLLVTATGASAGDRWIPIAGTVGTFRTDTRIVNPASSPA